MAKRALIALAAAVGLAAPAWADAIDGDWCAKDGRHFSIRGPAIITPSGIQTEGNYGRHSFSYVSPDGEESAGEPVAMLLLNEDTVQVQAGGETETWLRCEEAIT